MIKYCQIMDHDSIVQDLVAPGDTVLSTVECSWNDAFRILALVEHQSWSGGGNGVERNDDNKTTTAVRRDVGESSPDAREFAILFLDGRAPILTKNDLSAVHVIPVSGNSFTCEIDMESCGEDGEICVKLAPNLLEPEILVKMAPGNRSQNFIDEVFRAAQMASSTSVSSSHLASSSSATGAQVNEEGVNRSNAASAPSPSTTLGWLTYYENLVLSSTNNYNSSSSTTILSSSSVGSATQTNPSALSAPHQPDDFLRASVSFNVECFNEQN
ncbi:unnamed protein product [Orchesella dallaii]|uniref:Uncharacterized protein n=1 Tax=Orchesella dallaii TaxID=48710 RepID=A0ABP1QIB2_9HEXA